MKIILLTHQREINKPTNTGIIALKHAGVYVERIIWDRVNPDAGLVEKIHTNNALLLFPTGNQNATCIASYKNIIIIDSTWQQARKIYNKSPYLKKAPAATLSTTNGSEFRLRRNQIEGGLCTIECVIELLKLKGREELASQLRLDFMQFNRPGNHSAEGSEPTKK